MSLLLRKGEDAILVEPKLRRCLLVVALQFRIWEVQSASLGSTTRYPEKV